MRTPNINDPAMVVEIAFNHSYANARREQSRVLGALYRSLVQRLRAPRPQRECGALSS